MPGQIPSDQTWSLEIGANENQSSWRQLMTGGLRPFDGNGVCARTSADTFLFFAGRTSDSRMYELEVWPLKGDYPVWRFTIPSGSSPVPRHESAFSYLDDVLYVFGGQGLSNAFHSYNYTNDSWVSLPNTGAPSPRAGAQMAAMNDQNGDTLVFLFGGALSQHDFLSDFYLWTWADQWKPIVQNTVPPARASHSLSVLLPLGILMMFGGWDNSRPFFDEVWLYDPKNSSSEWTSGDLIQKPVSRAGFAYDFLPPNSFIIHGGMAQDHPDLNDTWILQLGQPELTETSSTGSRLIKTFEYTKTETATESTLEIQTDNKFPAYTQLEEMWTDCWYQPPVVSPSSPTVRIDSCGVYFPTKESFVIHSGWLSPPNTGDIRSDSWVFSLNFSSLNITGSWTEVTLDPISIAPPPNSGAACGRTSAETYLLFGGRQVAAPARIYELVIWPSTGDPFWRPLSPSGVEPTLATEIGGTYINDVLYWFGGQGTNAFGGYNYSNNSWITLSNGGDTPSARANARLSAVKRKEETVIFLFGGTHGTSTFDDMYSWTESTEWTRIWVTTPPHRANHGLFFLEPGNLVLFGGSDNYGPDPIMNDIWFFNATGYAPLWHEHITNGVAPSDRHWFASDVIPPDHFIIFGGLDNVQALNEIWIFTGENSSLPVPSVYWESSSFTRNVQKTVSVTQTDTEKGIASFVPMTTTTSLSITTPFSTTHATNPVSQNTTTGHSSTGQITTTNPTDHSSTDQITTTDSSNTTKNASSSSGITNTLSTGSTAGTTRTASHDSRSSYFGTDSSGVSSPPTHDSSQLAASSSIDPHNVDTNAPLTMTTIVLLSLGLIGLCLCLTLVIVGVVFLAKRRKGENRALDMELVLEVT